MRPTLLTIFFVLTACGGDPRGTIQAEGHRFVPERLTVDSGAPVTFSNPSDEPHTFTGDEDSWPDGADYVASGGFSSETDARQNVTKALLTEGETFDIAGLQPGTYRFFCIPHEADGMAMTIVVR